MPGRRRRRGPPQRHGPPAHRAPTRTASSQLTAIPDFDDQRLDLVTPRARRVAAGARRGRDRAQLAPARAASSRARRSTSRRVDGKLHDLTVAGDRPRGRRRARVLRRPGVRPRDARDAPAPGLRRRRSTSSGSSPRTRRWIATASARVTDDVTRPDRGRRHAGLRVVTCPVPGKHPANDLLQGFFLVLGVIGALSPRRVRVPRREHRVGDPRPADPPDRRDEGDRRPERPDRRAVPRARARPTRCSSLAVALPLGALGRVRLHARSPRASRTSTSRLLRSRRSVFLLEIAVGLVVPLARRARAGHPRRPHHRPRGARERRHRRPVRPRPLRPAAPGHPRRSPTHAAEHPQHVPAQGPPES